MPSKPSNREIEKTTKEFQEKEKGGADSNRQFRQAGHDAREDYQKAGEPSGPLSNRTPDAERTSGAKGGTKGRS